MVKLNIEILSNKSIITAPNGYCFYDTLQKERMYITKLITPTININELEKRYIVIEGDANILNAELQQEDEVE